MYGCSKFLCFVCTPDFCSILHIIFMYKYLFNIRNYVEKKHLEEREKNRIFGLWVDNIVTFQDWPQPVIKCT